MRNNICEYGPLEKYIDPSIKDDYLQKVNQAVDWIYGDGQSASKDVYKEKLQEFKKVGVPVKQRASLHQDLPIYLEKFALFQQEVNDKIAVATNLTDQGRQDAINKLTEMTSYFTQIQQAVATKQPYEDLGFKIEEINGKYEAFKDTINKLLSIPPPQPPQAEKSAEGQKESDVEMKEEIPTGPQ